MTSVRIGHTCPMPPALSDDLAAQLYAVDPYIQWEHERRACAIDLASGETINRCGIRVFHPFVENSWEFGVLNPHPKWKTRVDDVVGIRPSPHALPPALATEAGRWGEFRMGASRYTVTRRSGDPVTVISESTAWLPDSVRGEEVTGLTSDHQNEFEVIGPTLYLHVSTPQTNEAIRERYEKHFQMIGSVPRGGFRDGNRAARSYADGFPLVEWEQAWHAMWDRVVQGASRYERSQLDSIDVVARFAEREGHCSVPEGHTEEGWTSDFPFLAMLWHEGLLPDTARLRLEALPGWGEAADEAVQKLLASHRDHREYEIQRNARSIWLSKIAEDGR